MKKGTRLIHLTQGKFATVSACDFEYLNQWSWTVLRAIGKYAVRFYAYRRKRYGPRSENRSHVIYMHREVAERAGLEKANHYDHCDCDGLHNWRKNIRPATQRQNLGNSRKRGGNCSSKFKGVYWDKPRAKWHSSIQVYKKTVHLGRFDNEPEAALAYDAAARRVFGEFARLNFG